jgi:hypothetical protein
LWQGVGLRTSHTFQYFSQTAALCSLSTCNHQLTMVVASNSTSSYMSLPLLNGLHSLLPINPRQGWTNNEAVLLNKGRRPLLWSTSQQTLTSSCDRQLSAASGC